ncbi:hypothetical protein BVRB_4g082330 [Beta vulgaris subsp. vulgaris]|nr:hypothetical protein BVRB_4g082330 [Beta vulgaris subsp. vulgaris]
MRVLHLWLHFYSQAENVWKILSRDIGRVLAFIIHQHTQLSCQK